MNLFLFFGALVEIAAKALLISYLDQLWPTTLTLMQSDAHCNIFLGLTPPKAGILCFSSFSSVTISRYLTAFPVAPALERLASGFPNSFIAFCGICDVIRESAINDCVVCCKALEMVGSVIF
ncbi:MAG: hypothetical protein NTZ53_00420 [Cyanobacteria bacterium]|nr:hypothetical protein [Cyanobacteriota bacterium]